MVARSEMESSPGLFFYRRGEGSSFGLPSLNTPCLDIEIITDRPGSLIIYGHRDK